MSDDLSARPRVDNHEDICRFVGVRAYDRVTKKADASAFSRKKKDHDGLSVNRRGVFSEDVNIDNANIRAVMRCRLSMKATETFIVLNTGAILDALTEFGREVFVCQDPLPADGDILANPAHALIVGLPFKDEPIGSMTSEAVGDILRRLVTDYFPAA